MSSTSQHCEGLDLSIAVKVWVNLAASECRLELLRDLEKFNLGFKDVEDYNADLNLKFRSTAFKSGGGPKEKKVVKEAMALKLRDERKYNSEKIRERNIWRRKINHQLGENTKRARTVIKNLRNEATKVRTEHREKYTEKINHLKKKFHDDQNEKLDSVPDELTDYASLSIFSSEKFEEIKTADYEITKVGEISLSGDETQLLRLHPKFALLSISF